MNSADTDRADWLFAWAYRLIPDTQRSLADACAYLPRGWPMPSPDQRLPSPCECHPD